MRWLALAGMLLPLALVAAWAGYVTINALAPQSAFYGVADAIVLGGLVIAYAAIPCVIGIAVLRPDLFEVSRVLASTATHAALTVVVLSVFTAANFAAGLLLPGDFRGRRRRGDRAVRAPARAAASAAAAARRPLVLPHPEGCPRGDRGAEPANGDHAGSPRAA